MKLVESILKKNPCYTAGKKITVRGLMLHSVGCPQPKASVFINSWNKESYKNACVHAFIDGNDGTVYQTLPWNHRGWHCASGSKGSGNNTHIGVEMCEPACIKYTGGSSFTCSDKSTAKAVVQRTYQSAVELFAMLCKKYNLNPIADGVIISHKEGYKRGIASNHGDPEHLWKGLGLSYTMDGFRKDVKKAMAGNTTVVPETNLTAIIGAAVATEKQMQEYIKKVNPNVAQSVIDMIPLYLAEGKTEGVRGDIAFAQSCLETGNFGFSQSAVTLDQNNFAGMGVTQNGMKGLSFETSQLGIRCQIQHLKAYASKEDLVNTNIDPRFKYVTRGSAPYVQWLGIQENPNGYGWAAGAGYGDKILTILSKIIGTTTTTEDSPVVKEMNGYVEVIYKGSDGLNVRKTPTMGNNVSQVIYGGVYTVTGISADGEWYRLKSGGYITTNKKYVSYRKQLEVNDNLKPYKVRVEVNDLNIRKGPGTNYKKTGKFTGKGTFTIVEEKIGQGSTKGWGKLKSNEGWISLDYTIRA